MTQTVIFLASCPKSNSVVDTIENIYNNINSYGVMRVPYYLKNSSNNYLNPHDFGGYVNQKYLNSPFSFVKFKAIAFEKRLMEWINKIKGK